MYLIRPQARPDAVKKVHSTKSAVAAVAAVKAVEVATSPNSHLVGLVVLVVNVYVSSNVIFLWGKETTAEIWAVANRG